MELHPLPLGKHLQTIVTEYSNLGTVYGYSQKKFYKGFDGIDLSINIHGETIPTPIGPAAGPHTQLLPNILLSFLSGGRFLELKTVQILDQLKIPRPCIDARNVCYNVEWSQELSLAQSYQEYVNAWVLLKILEAMEILGIPKGSPFYHCVFDISVGYNLAGISSPPMRKWISGMCDATEAIAQALEGLPSGFRHLQNIKISPQIARSVTISTFHGCPRSEIEAIAQHLMEEYHLHVTIKMNPTLLGYDFVHQILHEDLGYKHIELDPIAFEHDLPFEEAIAMIQRLVLFGKERKCEVGVKFTNTLVVKNNEKIFQDKLRYLSGAPLHVLAMHTLHRVRTVLGASFLVSFSAGISRHNFVDTLLCNIKPITTCTDLLSVGGYSRIYDDLKALKESMEEAGCKTIPEFIIHNSQNPSWDVNQAGHAYAQKIIPQLAQNPRYHSTENSKQPKKSETILHFLDCSNCQKCISVCPNVANFVYSVDSSEPAIKFFFYHDGKFETRMTNGWKEASQKVQIANIADFCNECGNCSTFCSEQGKPFQVKPRFFSTQETYERYSGTNGFYFPTPHSLKGKIGNAEYLLTWNPQTQEYIWRTPDVELCVGVRNNIIWGKWIGSRDNVPTIPNGSSHECIPKIDAWPYYAMRLLLDGITKTDKAHYSQILRPE